MDEISKSIEIGGRKLTLSAGKLATQADAAVLASLGETVVLATVVSATPSASLGYFPLSVDYLERLYAGGRIKGSRWVKREGRPSDNEILTGRLIDRSIRPLFPKNYKKEVQVTVTVLSVDFENNPDVLSAVAASAALSLSKIPWNGPIVTIRVGLKNKEFISYPTDSELSSSGLDLIVSTTKDAIIMVEAGAREVPEETILDAIAFGQKEAEKIHKLINDLTSDVNPLKEKIEESESLPYHKIKKTLEKLAKDNLVDLIKRTSIKKASIFEYNELKSAVLASYSKEEAPLAAEAYEDLFRELGRDMVLKGVRPDGRKSDRIRNLSAEVGVLPRTHGSAIFSRGETQVLTVTTLGSHALEQLIESAVGEESKRYIHHYSMPPYATGETGKIGFPSRREIGHSALAERAIAPVIPPEASFPYTIRVVSEILSSNGSTSMASVCGSTLSLMDAGVPLNAPVSGIAMGLVVVNEKNFVVLSDITGLEDTIGDMDFKVAGTREGVTALQLDVKTLNLTLPILKEAFTQAKKGREEILKLIVTTIASSRPSVSPHAPKIKVLKIAQDKIGEVIGPGGRMIKKIIAETNAQIEVEDDGTVHLIAPNDEALNLAAERIEGLVKEVLPGEIYEGTVKKIQPFGAFVEILPGKEGLVHVSDMSEDFVSDPKDMVGIGDRIRVRVKEKDPLGRINLSMLMDASHDKPRLRKKVKHFDRRASGPHFPASRLLGENKRRFGR